MIEQRNRKERDSTHAFGVGWLRPAAFAVPHSRPLEERNTHLEELELLGAWAATRCTSPRCTPLAMPAHKSGWRWHSNGNQTWQAANTLSAPPPVWPGCPMQMCVCVCVLLEGDGLAKSHKKKAPGAAVPDGRRRDCHSAAPLSHFSRGFNGNGEGVSAK